MIMTKALRQKYLRLINICIMSLLIPFSCNTCFKARVIESLLRQGVSDFEFLEKFVYPHVTHKLAYK